MLVNWIADISIIILKKILIHTKIKELLNLRHTNQRIVNYPIYWEILVHLNHRY